MANPVIWFELLSETPERLQAFYSETFNWSIDRKDPNYGMVKTGSEEGIQGGIGKPQGPGRPWVTFYIKVDDINAALSQIESRGGKTALPRTEMPDVTLAVFIDPDGNPIGLVEG